MTDSFVQQVEALASDRGVQPLRLTVTGKKKITLWAAPRPEERDDRAFPHMWVHRLSIRRSKPELFILKDTWEALPEVLPTETLVHEWPAVSDWVGLMPPVSFETKQKLLTELEFWARQAPSQLHAWMAEAWPDETVKWEFEIWKSVVNPRFLRSIGYVFAFHADAGKACVALIVLELDIMQALYHYATTHFKEEIVEQYALLYKPEEQEELKERLRHSKFGFELGLRGVDVQVDCGRKYLHGPPLRQEELRSSLQNLVESFRRSRAARETEVAVFLAPPVLDILLGGKFSL